MGPQGTRGPIPTIRGPPVLSIAIDGQTGAAGGVPHGGIYFVSVMAVLIDFSSTAISALDQVPKRVRARPGTLISSSTPAKAKSS